MGFISDTTAILIASEIFDGDRFKDFIVAQQMFRHLEEMCGGEYAESVLLV